MVISDVRRAVENSIQNCLGADIGQLVNDQSVKDAHRISLAHMKVKRVFKISWREPVLVDKNQINCTVAIHLHS